LLAAEGFIPAIDRRIKSPTNSLDYPYKCAERKESVARIPAFSRPLSGRANAIFLDATRDRRVMLAFAVELRDNRVE
jgi:hypothetical protein